MHAGGVAYAVTQIPGSSAWFDRGVVVYSNEAKQRLLAVPAAYLRDFGAVSEPVARAMATGALQQGVGHAAIAVTGIAGPGGGSAEKPVGTVFSPGRCAARPRLRPGCSRQHVTSRAIAPPCARSPSSRRSTG